MNWGPVVKAAGAAFLGKAIQHHFTIECPCGNRRNAKDPDPCPNCGHTLLAWAANSDHHLRSLPRAFLDRWTNVGAKTTSQSAYHTVKDHLESELTDVYSHDAINLFLQGSYKNHTTIHGDSDVDVVCLLKVPVVWDGTVQLHPNSADVDASPQEIWDAFHDHALSALRSRFGRWSTTDGNRAIEVGDGANDRATDVLLALQASYYHTGREEWYMGVTFPDDRTRTWMINFPKKHFRIGAQKNEACGGTFRRTVRMFKNARSYLVSDGRLGSKTAPGYFLSCLLYNVPSRLYSSNEEKTFFECLRWLTQKAREDELHTFVCQHEMHRLFGDRPETWNIEDAREFLAECRKLWFEGP